MTVLSVFKPWGRIRSTRGESSVPAAGHAVVSVSGSPLATRIFLVVAGLILATVVALHIAGRGMGGSTHGM
jgi:hypothetical protein